MEYDLERIANECEELITVMRPFLMGKPGPVIMTTLSFLVCEALNNVCEQEDFEKNLRVFASSVRDTFETAKQILGDEQ